MGYHLRPFPESLLARRAEQLVFLAAFTLVLAVLITRSGRISGEHGVGLIVLGCMLAAAALAVAGVAAVEMWQRGLTGLGMLLRVAVFAMLVLGYPAWLTIEAIRLPVLADISTDIEDPPAFSQSQAALAARRGHVPAGIEARRRAPQLAAYPAVKPLLIEAEARESFDLVKDALKALGWRIIDEAVPGGRSGQGRIEAISRSRLMQFETDIAIRLRPLGGQTRIDIRAASRFGRHDLGSNAANILRLLEEIKAQKE